MSPQTIRIAACEDTGSGLDSRIYFTERLSPLTDLCNYPANIPLPGLQYRHTFG
ncbi:MAG: hypothetical protein ACHQIM_15370 [Sphingobacteriales bacterium]